MKTSPVPVGFFGIFIIGLTVALASGEVRSPRVAEVIIKSKMTKSIHGSGLLENPLQADDIKEAITYLQSHRDYSSYLLLIVARRFYPELYVKIAESHKAEILCSALKHTELFNDWGLLHDPIRSAAGLALLGTGKQSIKYLIPLLDDSSDAPLVDDSEASTLSRAFKYRRKDFAFRYLSAILERPYKFDVDPLKRDKHIDGLKRALLTNEKEKE